jgi:hypothetical protein
MDHYRSSEITYSRSLKNHALRRFIREVVNISTVSNRLCENKYQNTELQIRKIMFSPFSSLLPTSSLPYVPDGSRLVHPPAPRTRSALSTRLPCVPRCSASRAPSAPAGASPPKLRPLLRSRATLAPP